MSNVLFTRQSIKEIAKISSLDRKRVLKKVESFVYPLPKNLDVKLLNGTLGFYRLRVGQIRIIFEYIKNEDTFWIRKIGYRGSVYKI